LGKNYTIDKFSSEGRPNVCGTQTATKPVPVLWVTIAGMILPPLIGALSISNTSLPENVAENLSTGFQEIQFQLDKIYIPGQ
jgi:hypothetical protein